MSSQTRRDTWLFSFLEQEEEEVTSDHDEWEANQTYKEVLMTANGQEGEIRILRSLSHREICIHSPTLF